MAPEQMIYPRAAYGYCEYGRGGNEYGYDKFESYSSYGKGYGYEGYGKNCYDTDDRTRSETCKWLRMSYVCGSYCYLECGSQCHFKERGNLFLCA